MPVISKQEIIHFEDGSSQIIDIWPLHTNPKPDPDPDPPSTKKATVETLLNVRESPSGQVAQTGGLKQGEVIDVDAEYVDLLGYRWRGIQGDHQHAGKWAAEAPINAPGEPDYARRYMSVEGIDYGGGNGGSGGTKPSGRWSYTDFVMDGQVVPTFTKDGKIHPIRMANMRPLAFLGKGIEPFQHSTMHYVNFTLDRLKFRNAFNCIRLYAPLRGHDDEWLIERIHEALNLLEGRLTAFITLVDCVYGSDAPHHFEEDVPFYRNGYITPEYFTTKQYRQRMLPFAQKLVRALKSRDVFAYGVANEMTTQYQGKATDEQQAAGISFLHEVADMIHAEDSDVLVTPGLLNIAHLHNGNGPMRDLWEAVYDGHFDFAGVNFYETEGQEPGALWENEQEARDYDLPFSRLDRIPIMGTEAWRHNLNPHGTAAVKAKWEQWSYIYNVELSPWAAYFGPDHNATSKDVGWSSAFDDQWESSRVFFSEEYSQKQNRRYGLDW